MSKILFGTQYMYTWLVNNSDWNKTKLLRPRPRLKLLDID